MPATAAQQIANLENAQHSTGPRTEEGKAASSRNAIRLGLFTAKDYVLPEEEDTYESLCGALWNELRPIGALEEIHALEIIRGSWRLQRCARIEGELADQALASSTADPLQNEAAARTQNAVDRARTAAHNAIRRGTAELRKLQTNREIANATAYSITDNGIADPQQVAKGAMAIRKAGSVDSFEALLTNADLVVRHNQRRMMAEREMWKHPEAAPAPQPAAAQQAAA